MSLLMHDMEGSDQWSPSDLLDYRKFLCVFAAFVLYKLVRAIIVYPRFLSPLRALPGPPIGHPLLGQAPRIFSEERIDHQRKWTKEYGPVHRIVGPIFSERLVFLEPEALNDILVKGWLELPRPDYIRHVMGFIVGHGLLTAEGSDHKQMRKAMNPAFSLSNITAQTSMYYEPIEGLIGVLDNEIKAQTDAGSESTTVMIYEWLSKTTLDIICETAFGYRSDSLHNPDNELAKAYEYVLDLQSGPNIAFLALVMFLPGGHKALTSDWTYRHRSLFQAIPILSPLTKLLSSLRTIREISKQMLESKILDASLSGVGSEDTHTKKDIMSILVRARRQSDIVQDDSYSMSDDTLIDQVMTFLGAGHETTASGLTWSLWLLANNTEAQQRLRDEVTPVLAANPRPEYRVLKELQYLDCVLNESLRVLPPVPITTRKAEQAIYVNGVLVPKGALVHVDIWSVNTWEAVWGKDAEEFRPERWLDLPQAYDPVYSSISFISGPHGCIGKTMAVIEMKAILACLIAKFEFLPAYEGQVAKTTAAITMKPADGMPLKIRRIAS